MPLFAPRQRRAPFFVSLALAAGVMTVPALLCAQQLPISVRGGIGWISAEPEGYLVLGAGVDYHLNPLLSLGVDVDTRLANDPNVTRLGPRATVSLGFVPIVVPYAGVFYRRWFISNDIPDTNSWGARLGLSLPIGPALVAYGGVVYERGFPCDLESCDDWYPEFGAQLRF